MMKNGFGIVAAVLLASSTVWAGGQVGNGGDTVSCTAISTSRFQGLYTLDYLQTLGAGGVELGIVPVESWEASAKRIGEALRVKVPYLYSSFADFVERMGNTRDWTQPRIWLPAPHGLIQINDQEVIRALPTNCTHEDSSGQGIDLIQTVIRIHKSDIIEYNVDLAVVDQLAATPLQYSFLMVHEWLWDHTDDVQAVRWANQLLHSDQLDTLSGQNLAKSLSNIGINKP